MMNNHKYTEEKQLNSITNSSKLTQKIHTIRGVQVMLDYDLAELYGYETKNLNKQVKRNIERFPKDFMFQLREEELSILRFQNGTSSKHGGIRYLPYAFTEQGVYMLATVLKSETAIRQSIMIMRTFKEMRHYLADNQFMITTQEYLRLSMQVSDNTKSIQNIKEEMIHKDHFEEVMKEFIAPNRMNEYLFLNGEKISANLAYEQIYHSAKQSIYIVDNYIGLKTLIHLKNVPNTINIILFSGNIRKGLTLSELNDFTKEYPNVKISFQMTNGKYHGRYIILDYGTSNEVIYHCGVSSKDAGNKISSIVKMNDIDNYKKMINDLMQNQALNLK